jgi:transposase
VALWKLYRKMRRISQEKEQNIVALIERGRSSREIAKSVGLAQSTVNRVRKRFSTSVALPKGGRPKVLTEREKRYASWLVTVGGLETATEASKVL